MVSSSSTGDAPATRTASAGDERLRLAVVVASVRANRFGPTVAGWFAARAALRDDVSVAVIDLADERDAHAFAARIDDADAIVIVTPEYNHGYPGPLKTAIDSAGAQWHAKPVAFVSYGGRSGGLRAVEQLRAVFAELHAVTVRETVSFHGAWSAFGDDGAPRDGPGTSAAATALLDQTAWWAHALRAARRAQPYGATPAAQLP